MKNGGESPAAPPALGLGLGVVVASSASILIRYAQPEVPSLVIAAYRMAIASLALAPVVLLRHRPELRKLNPTDLRRIGLAGLLLAAHFATWISSLEYTSVASSVVLVQTMPLFVALLSPWVLREPVRRAVLLGLGVSMLGTALVAISDACVSLPCPELALSLAGPALRGDALAVAGALAGAGYVLIGRLVRPRVELVPYVGLAYSAAAAALALLALGLQLPVVGFPGRNLLWLALLALGPQLFAHSTYNWALKYLPAAVVSLALLGEPVGSTVLALLLLDERPPLMRVLGGVLILAGIGLATGLSRARPARRQTV